MAKGKNVLTTGDVAKICNVAPRTVSKWFDSGNLKGYRIPGSKDRRIPMGELIRFMKANNLPIVGLMVGKVRVLVADAPDSDSVVMLGDTLRNKADYEVQFARSNFETGLMAQKFTPHAMLINLAAKEIDATEICKNIRSIEELQTTKIIAIASQLSRPELDALLQKGFDGYITNPRDPNEVIRAIEQATAIVY